MHTRPDAAPAITRIWMNAMLKVNQFRSWAIVWMAYLLLGLGFGAHAQEDIPIGTWRMHLSYTSVQNIEVADNVIYAASQGGLFALDKDDYSIRSFSKLDGFSDVNISALKYIPNKKLLIIGYNNGNIDLYRDGQVTNISGIVRATIVGSKRINDIHYNNGSAYLSCDFGLVVVNVDRAEIRSSNQQLGNNGAVLKVSSSVVYQDTLYLATAAGVKYVSLNRNLMNSANYMTYQANNGLPVQAYGYMNIWRNRLYVSSQLGSNTDQVLLKNGSTWTDTRFALGTIKRMTSSADSIYIVVNNQITTYGPNGGFSAYRDQLITDPQDAEVDAQGHLWIGDVRSGLVGNPTGVLESFKANGPYATSYVRLQTSGNKLLAAAGTIDIAGYRATGNRSGYAVFENNTWTNTNVELGNFAFGAVDVVDVAYDPISGNEYAGTYGSGVIIKRPNGSFDRLTEGYPASSGLVRLFRGQGGDTNYVRISCVKPDSRGQLWMLNFGSIAGKNVTMLHSYSPQTGQMRAWPVPISGVTWENGYDMVIANNNDKWILLANRQDINGQGFSTRLGVLVINENNRAVLLNNSTASGEFPGEIVYDMAKDSQGAIWIAMNKGFGVYYNPASVLAATTVPKISLPIINGRPVLENDVVRAIAIDGADRKWVASNTGVYLFDKEITRVIATYTAENSPLISNNVNDIAINPLTGEVFFSTDIGICSFRSDATGEPGAQAKECQSTKVFPQPVPSNYSGLISITGIPNNSIVKITDLNGKLVWETKSNGTSAFWTGKDYNGARAKTGIYTVYIASEDGSAGCVTKLALIE